MKFESNLSTYILSEFNEIRLTSVFEQDDSVLELDDSLSESVLWSITTTSKIFGLHCFLLSIGVKGFELWQQKNTIISSLSHIKNNMFCSNKIIIVYT